jgi:hypothetical protein
MNEDTAHKIATKLFSADRRNASLKVPMAVLFEVRHEALVHALQLVPDATAWWAPVEVSENGGGAYVLCPGLFVQVRADFGLEPDDSRGNGAALHVTRLRPDHRASVDIVRTFDGTIREWAFALGTRTLRIVTGPLQDDRALSDEPNQFAEALARELGWTGVPATMRLQPESRA